MCGPQVCSLKTKVLTLKVSILSKSKVLIKQGEDIGVVLSQFQRKQFIPQFPECGLNFLQLRRTWLLESGGIVLNLLLVDTRNTLQGSIGEDTAVEIEYTLGVELVSHGICPIS